MTVWLELFDGDVDGVALTTSNTIYNAAITGTAPVFDDDVSLGGVDTTMLIAAGSNAANGRFDGFSTYQMSFSWCFVFADVTPSALDILVHLRTSTGTNIAAIYLTTSGRVAALNSQNAVIDTTSTTGPLLVDGTKYRVDGVVTVDAGNANAGRVQYRVCDITSDPLNDTPVQAAFDSGANENLGTTPIGRFYGPGSVSNVTRGGAWNIGIVRADDSKSTFYDHYEPPAGDVLDTVYVKVDGVWEPGIVWSKADDVWVAGTPSA